MTASRLPIPDDDRDRARRWLARCRRIQNDAKRNLEGAR